MTELEQIERTEYEAFHAESKKVGEQMLRIIMDVKAPVAMNAIALVASFIVDRFPVEAKVASATLMIESMEALIKDIYPKEGQTIQ